MHPTVISQQRRMNRQSVPGTMGGNSQEIPSSSGDTNESEKRKKWTAGVGLFKESGSEGSMESHNDSDESFELLYKEDDPPDTQQGNSQKPEPSDKTSDGSQNAALSQVASSKPESSKNKMARRKNEALDKFLRADSLELCESICSSHPASDDNDDNDKTDEGDNGHTTNSNQPR
ncbi:hypothetical protein L204_104022 [Cryptococcus depauperatus]|nr:hypothetical protein L204_03175 [Cryptococcus depauperatus CBS 7855]